MFFDYAPPAFDYYSKTFVLNIFALNNFDLGDNLKAEIGIRGSYLSKTKSFLPSASLNLKYFISSNLSLGFNYGRYYQYLYTLKKEEPRIFSHHTQYIFFHQTKKI